ncbi:hypothetical protein [Leptospira sarikeiensis]|uniref:Uncharacterized protein n=1 Tax=Leptospira sarikeiensis TaxID=2484943 RepID=A0A4R9K8I4_9LEPT|nr:hypothetical protein [Leptospira sarikeiensis]TGL62916.1 hypothetical protein EHQ64_08395 [Leptospira sarikeiensis]
MLKRVLFFSFILLYITPAYSFTPGKWSHTDRIVLGLEKGGPTQELVKDSKGNVIYTAKYEYDPSGKLIRENYIGKDGKPDGFTKFIYTDGKISKEELYNKDGVNLEAKVFGYNKSGVLSSIELLDQNGKNILTCTILSWGENGLIREAQTEWADTKITERFAIVKDPNKPGLFQQNIYNEDKQQAASTVLTFDSNGKLLSRMNVQGTIERMNRLIWDKDNRLQQFTFLVKQGDKWAVEKTHELVYGK